MSSGLRPDPFETPWEYRKIRNSAAVGVWVGRGYDAAAGHTSVDGDVSLGG